MSKNEMSEKNIVERLTEIIGGGVWREEHRKTAIRVLAFFAAFDDWAEHRARFYEWLYAPASPIPAMRPLVTAEPFDSWPVHVTLEKLAEGPLTLSDSDVALPGPDGSTYVITMFRGTLTLQRDGEGAK